MFLSWKRIGKYLTLLSFTSVFAIENVLSQPIPAADGTGTIVTPNGDRFDIHGGTLSGDAANLFHSFQQFGLNPNQIANFLSNPQIQNILGRVVGGEASVIDGLIQVTGGNSNLFLMNPAGIIFGINAQLDVPANFTATTANGIQFGDRWFNASGGNDYATLLGNPTGLAFTMSQPGVILNAADLAVKQGQNLSLVGGTVVSTGTVTAPGGEITITAVPGESLVRINQAGSLITIEIELPANGEQPSEWLQPIASLYDLLVARGGGEELGLTINSEGEVSLTGNDIPLSDGDVTAQKVTAQSAVLSANQNLSLVKSQLSTTGDLKLLAQDTVLVRDSASNPFSAKAGGELYVQGNQAIDILALNNSEPSFQSGGDLSLVSDGNISGDSHFFSGGNFSLRNLSQEPGDFFSLFDPIISADGDVTFGNYTGVALKVEATGSISGGDITITGPDTTLDPNIFGTDPDFVTLTTTPALILRAGLDNLDNLPSTFPVSEGGTNFQLPGGPSSPGNIDVSNINTSSEITFSSNGGPVILNASGNITVQGSINSFGRAQTLEEASGGDITLEAGGNITVTNDINSSAINNAGSNATSGSVTLEAGGSITTNAINSSANSGIGDAISGVISLEAGGSITTNDINSSANSGEGDVMSDDISLEAGGSITTNAINSSANSGEGDAISGDISLEAGGSITTNDNDINSSANSNFGNAISGSVTLEAGESITTNDIDSSAEANEDTGFAQGNSVNLTAGNSITTGNIITSAISEGDNTTSGSISLETGGSITTNAINSSASSEDADANATSGDITLEAGGSITTNDIDSSANSEFGNTTSGDITLEAGESITTNDNDIDSSASSGFGNATSGAIALEAGESITTNDIDSSADAVLNGVGGSAQGNSVNLTAGDSITTGNIDTYAISDGDNATGGAVTLDTRNAPPTEGNITFSSVNTSGVSFSFEETGQGEGGEVEILANGVIRGIGEVPELLVGEGEIIVIPSGNTIFTLGITNDTAEEDSLGSVTLQHDGGANNVPFIVGNADANGTVGFINEGVDGVVGISSGTFPVLSNGGVANGTPDGIDIISVNDPPNLSPTSVSFNTEINTPFEFTLADFITVTDANNDNTTLTLNNIFRGFVTRADGTPIGEGEVVSLNETLIYTPPINTTGELVSFSVNSNDVVSLSNSVEFIANIQDVPSPPPPPIPPPETVEIELESPFYDPPPPINTALADNTCASGSVDLPKVEAGYTEDFEKYLGDKSEKPTSSLVDVCNALGRVASITGVKPAIIYVHFIGDDDDPEARLALTLITEDGQFITKYPENSENATRKRVTETANNLTKLTIGLEDEVEGEAKDFLDNQSMSPEQLRTKAAKELSDWLIKPLKGELDELTEQSKNQKKPHLAFILPPGLRNLPLATLVIEKQQDEKSESEKQENEKCDEEKCEFLIKQYSVSLMPSLTLTDIRPGADLRNTQVLAGGLSKLSNDSASSTTAQEDLVATRDELTIIQGIKANKSLSSTQQSPLINEKFTLENLKGERNQQPYGIVHLATHATFKSKPEDSKIYLWTRQIPLKSTETDFKTFRTLLTEDSPVKLLVLSACETTVGDEDSERGFAGVAFQAGVKSVLASVWESYSPTTLLLMTAFYTYLEEGEIKAEALRKAQVAMLEGKIRYSDDRKHILFNDEDEKIEIKIEIKYIEDKELLNEDPKYPVHWGAFTIVGSPW